MYITVTVCCFESLALNKILAWLTEKVDEEDVRSLIAAIFCEVGSTNS